MFSTQFALPTLDLESTGKSRLAKKVHGSVKHYFRCFVLFALFSQSAMAKEIDQSLLVSIAVPVVAGVYSYVQDDSEGIKELVLASLFTAHMTTLLKNTVRRTRPNFEDDLSFPSGHAAGAFTGASYMHHRYGLLWGVPAYTVATVIAYERITSNKHYWTDVIAGSALGILSGYLFTVRYPNIWLESNFDPEERAYRVGFKAKF